MSSCSSSANSNGGGASRQMGLGLTLGAPAWHKPIKQTSLERALHGESPAAQGPD